MYLLDILSFFHSQMRYLGVPEWQVSTIQAMYANAKSRDRINNSYSDNFVVQVGVHQGSVLCPLLLIIVLEALSHTFWTGCPWELPFADGLSSSIRYLGWAAGTN